MSTIALTITDPATPIPAGWSCVCRSSDNTHREIVPSSEPMIRAVRAYREAMRDSLRSEGGIVGFLRRADEMWQRAGGAGPRPLITV